MANVFNRRTKIYKKSVNTPDYPENEWIINPTFVPNCEAKYMVVDGDNIKEMTIKEKAVIDYIAPIPKPEPPTTEELEKIRNVNVASKIANVYTIADEISMVRKLIIGESSVIDADIIEWFDVIANAKLTYPKS
ncbi:hypothetical protein GQ473_04720 [archaeon]|nr:hypothetical protein [archaeon]